MFGKKDVIKLSELSRVALSEGEAESLAEELKAILAYVEHIQEAPAPEGKKAPQLNNVMRPDGEPHEGGRYTSSLLAAAPKKNNSYIRVKKIITRE